MEAQYNLYEAKTQLSRLVDQAAAGETVIIAKGGKPMARLVPFEARPRSLPRQLGQSSRAAKGTDWKSWFKTWKAMDKEVIGDFTAATRSHLSEGAPRTKSRRKRRG